MSSSKTKKIVSIAALALCLAFAATFVLAFTACDDTDASADSGLTWGQERGYVIGGGSTYKSEDGGEDIFEEMPETLNSEIVEPVYVENPNVTITGEFDENGVAPCVFRNTRYSFTCEDGSAGYGCVACGNVPGDECKGHNGYVSYSGYTNESYFYPYTIAPISTTAETAEIQATLIFGEKPEVDGTVFSNFMGFMCIAISSITGEPLDVVRVTEIPLVYYSHHATCGEYDYAAYAYESQSASEIQSSYWLAYLHGAENDVTDRYNTSSVNINCYWVYAVELANGDEYEYGVKFFDPTRL